MMHFVQGLWLWWLKDSQVVLDVAARAALSPYQSKGAPNAGVK